MKTTQLELIALLEGEVTTSTLAARHGVTEQEVIGWKTAFVSGMKVSATRKVASRWPRGRWVAALAIVGTVAFAQLTTFSPNTPALASDVNGNFTQLKTWLEQKVGPVNTNIITTAGAVNAGSLNVSTSALVTGNLTARGDTALGAAGKTLTVTGGVALFGAPVSLVIGTLYSATTDGFLSATVSTNGVCNAGPVELIGLSGSPGALSVRQQTSAHGGCVNVDYPTPRAGFLLPIRKGEQYQVDISSGSGNASATFYPLGN